MRMLTVSKNEAGQRLDKLLAKYLNLAGKSFIYKMMRKKNITLNGKKCDGSEHLTEGDEIKLASSPSITTQCIRVPVTDGHLAAVFVRFDHKPSKEEILRRWKEFAGEPQRLNLPSAPKQFLTYFEEDNMPQTRLNRDQEHGMGVSIGRLREDSQYDYKFVCLSHNTIRGAAGGAVLMAELLAENGYL